MYLPMGASSDTIAWYSERCAAYSGSVLTRFKAKWYCDMADNLRKIDAGLRPPPPPEPPPFVALDVPPDSVIKGGPYEQWWKEKVASDERRRKLMLLAGVGLGAYLVLAR